MAKTSLVPFSWASGRFEFVQTIRLEANQRASAFRERISLGSVTHSYNQNQRAMRLIFTGSGIRADYPW